MATLSSAGHPPPLAIGPGSNPLRIKLEAGLPLGLFQESVYTDIAWTFEPTGGGLLLYTDGVSEAFNHHGEQFGDRRMSEILAAEAISTVSSTVAAIRRGVESFSASEVAADDMTILACIRTPSPP